MVHKKGLQLGTTTFGKEMHIRTTFLSFCGINILPKKGGTCTVATQLGTGSYFNATLIFKIGQKKEDKQVHK